MKIKPTKFTVYPDGYEADWLPVDKYMWTLDIEYRGEAGYPGTDPERRWAVCHRGFVWTNDTGWEFEPQPSSRDKEWFGRARFSLDQCEKIVMAEIKKLEINGRTFNQMSEEWKNR